MAPCIRNLKLNRVEQSGKSTRYQMDKRMDEPQRWSGCGGNKKTPSPCARTQRHFLDTKNFVNPHPTRLRNYITTSNESADNIKPKWKFGSGIKANIPGVSL